MQKLKLKIINILLLGLLIPIENNFASAGGAVTVPLKQNGFFITTNNGRFSIHSNAFTFGITYIF